MNDREVSNIIATELLGWTYFSDTDTYCLAFGRCIGTAATFNPLRNEMQGNWVISELGLNCTRETLLEYILSLSTEEKNTILAKYISIQRKKSGIKYLTFVNGQWQPL